MVTTGICLHGGEKLPFRIYVTYSLFSLLCVFGLWRSSIPSHISRYEFECSLQDITVSPNCLGNNKHPFP